MMLTPPTIKQTLLQKIETLPDYKLQEVLDFVEFLLFKSQMRYKQAPAALDSQEILAGLTRIRETVHQTYGVYQGDLVAEARAERDQHLNATLGLDIIDESSD